MRPFNLLDPVKGGKGGEKRSDGWRSLGGGVACSLAIPLSSYFFICRGRLFLLVD